MKAPHDEVLCAHQRYQEGTLPAHAVRCVHKCLGSVVGGVAKVNAQSGNAVVEMFESSSRLSRPRTRSAQQTSGVDRCKSIHQRDISLKPLGDNVCVRMCAQGEARKRAWATNASKQQLVMQIDSDTCPRLIQMSRVDRVDRRKVFRLFAHVGRAEELSSNVDVRVPGRVWETPVRCTATAVALR
eukprot:4848160-Pleurochrysis_carterae.AAC.1